MPTFNSTALFRKSQLYIDRGLELDSNERHDEFQLWAVLSLELLAKSTLASKNPALIAELEENSMIAACVPELSRASKVKTAQASVIFKRLNLTVKDFTNDEVKQCCALADLRNAELHSGDLPFATMHKVDWLGRFWRSCEILLQAQGKDLTDWIGTKNAATAAKEIAHLQTISEIDKRVTKHRNIFKQKFSTESQRKSAKTLSMTFGLYGEFPAEEIDRVIRFNCPSCCCKALLGGRFWEENESYEEDGPYIEETYITESLKCMICGLKLEGRDELRAGKIPDDFAVEKEPEFDDYGND